MARVQIAGFKCERCGHVWAPRRNAQEAPRVCPKCKSPYWDRPPRKRANAGKRGEAR